MEEVHTPGMSKQEKKTPGQKIPAGNAGYERKKFCLVGSYYFGSLLIAAKFIS